MITKPLLMNFEQYNFTVGDRLSVATVTMLWMGNFIGLVDINTALSILATVTVMGYNIHKWYDYTAKKRKDKRRIKKNVEQP